MDTLFKMIDRLLHSIPPSAQKMVRLGALAAWGVLVILVVIWSFRAGSDSAPQTGDDMYLSNIKEKLYRDRMKRDPADITLPDLNELSKKEVAPLSVYQPESARLRSEDSLPDVSPLPIRGETDEIIFPEKGLRPERHAEPTTKPSEPALMPLER